MTFNTVLVSLLLVSIIQVSQSNREEILRENENEYGIRRRFHGRAVHHQRHHDHDHHDHRQGEFSTLSPVLKPNTGIIETVNPLPPIFIRNQKPIQEVIVHEPIDMAPTPIEVTSNQR